MSLTPKEEQLTPRTLTRKRVKEFNNSILDSSLKIEMNVEDVTEVLKQRRTLLKQQRSILLESTKIEQENNNSKLIVEPNQSLNGSRDYKTPDVDPIAMEAMRKEILEQLSKSVTKRRNKVAHKVDGTPVATKTNVESSIINHSPINNTSRPRRLCNVKKQQNEDSGCKSASDSEDDIEFPKWSERMCKILDEQTYVDPCLVELLFAAGENLNVDGKELFPTVKPSRLTRRRSSVHWEDL